MASTITIKVIADTKGAEEGAQRVERTFVTAAERVEAKERAHQQRLEQIRVQAAQKLQQIEAQKEARIELLRAQAAQKEIQRQRQLEDAVNRAAASAKRAADSTVSSLNLLRGAFAALAALGLASIIKSVGEAALDSAIKLDKTRQTLVALLKSSDAANQKIAELRQLAARSPGVTTSFATDLFTQLKAIGTIGDSTINKLIVSLGRLNAAFSIDSPQQFARNLTQIFNQSFERQDIKEAIGRVPIFDQILQQAFGTNDADKLRKLKASGKLTLDTFLTGISEAVANNPGLANIQESIGSIFAKAKDEALFALAPIGDEIANTLLPIIRDVGPAFADAAKTTADSLKDNRTEIRQVVASTEVLINSILRLGRESTQSLSLKTVLQDFNIVIESITTGLNIVRDLVEIVGAAILGAIKLIVREAESAIQSVVSGLTFGLVRVFEEDIARLNKGLDQLEGRINRGFENARRTRDDLRLARQGVQIEAQLNSLQSTEAGRRFLKSSGDFDDVELTPTPGVSPSKTTGGGGGESESTKAAKKAVRDAKEFAEARLAIERTNAEKIVEVSKAERAEILELFEDQYKRGLISAKEFYDKKLEIQFKNLDAERALIDIEISQQQEALARAKEGSAERVKIEERLIELRAKQALQLIQLDKLSRENLEEFKKAVGELKPIVENIPDVKVVNPAEKKRLEDLKALRQQQVQFSAQELEFRRQEVEIQNAVTQGVLTEAEGREAILAIQRESRDLQIKFLESREAREIDPEKIAQIRLQIEQLKNLGLELDPAQAFFKGLSDETQTLSEKLEGLGRQLRSTFVDLFQDLLEKGPKAFFQGLLSTLRSTLAQMTAELVASSIFQFFRPAGGGIAGGGAQVGTSGGGAAGVFRSVIGALGGGGAGGLGFGGGGLFNIGATTPGFNPGASSPTGIFANGQFAAGLAGIGGGGSVARGTGFGSILPTASGQFSNFLTKIGLGNPSGTAIGALGSIAPLLGLSLGAGVGGTSVLGQILGAGGGLATGIGLSFGASVLGAGGGIGQAALAALGPIALIGVPLLIGAFFLGKASQRKRDEEASGAFLTQAIQRIEELRRQVDTDQVDGSQARAIFENQILADFINQISQLKTESVRKSRLTNQVRDLRAVYDANLGPAIAAQQQRKRVNQNLIPEFATGGVVPGFNRGFDSVHALLTPGEIVLNQAQQAAIQSMAGMGVFAKAGVPDAGVQAGMAQAFQFGGVARDFSAPISLNLEVSIGMSQSGAEEIFAAAGSSDTGQQVIVSSVRVAQKMRKLP